MASIAPSWPQGLSQVLALRWKCQRHGPQSRLLTPLAPSPAENLQADRKCAKSVRSDSAWKRARQSDNLVTPVSRQLLRSKPDSYGGSAPDMPTAPAEIIPESDTLRPKSRGTRPEKPHDPEPSQTSSGLDHHAGGPDSGRRHRLLSSAGVAANPRRREVRRRSLPPIQPKFCASREPPRRCSHAAMLAPHARRASRFHADDHPSDASGNAGQAGDLLVEFDRQAQMRDFVDKQADYQKLVDQVAEEQAKEMAARAKDETELKTGRGQSAQKRNWRFRRRRSSRASMRKKIRRTLDEAKATYDQLARNFRPETQSGAGRNSHSGNSA